MSEQPTIIDIIRHGEPLGGSKYRGQIDDPLSDRGWQQMREAVAGRDEWQHIVSSDLSRCAAFAREVGERLRVGVTLEAGFREVGFGSWEGKDARTLLQESPEGIAAFWRDPIHNTPPGAEPLREFQRRVVGAWEEMVQQHAGKQLLLVGHAGMMRILLLHALGLPLEAFYRFDPRNASMVRIRIDTGRHGEAYHQLVFPRPVMHAFWLALQFLTRLPVPTGHEYTPVQAGRSLAWYPLIGLFIGALLLAAATLLQGQEPLLAAALLLVLWVGLTGALHLDGLADTADAWVGGQGERERTLAIMKDPASGPIGVSALLLVLLLKFAALTVVLAHGATAALLLLPALARSAVALLFVTTPYVRRGGLGEALAQHAPRAAVFAGALGVALLLPLGLGLNGVAVMVIALLLWLTMRWQVMRRLGGFTGDIAGALLELIECAALLVIALGIPHI